ncbi:hypothetical protein B6D19_04725 [Gilliamella apicola]|uniref:hypothetical protein n=1 Tax=Gilliamella apicola TaxID=1196095 RepID=UPI000A334EB1|nr:hypothetical protein [Gilliamella apicola]OTP87342.1 hypothetical protein B5S42_10665 [Gilliamella apicola]OTQ08377.1 hypothetical protein B6C87_11520 [Gilliamella apicola]OTQ32618.1 hypothetical protein B6D19_04725 [Gilliamella apicola]OTQ41066.1 hypothetical protein B6D20_09510 [Gilliamella apicola]
MYCRNSITLHLIRGLGAVMLIIGVFIFQLSIVTKLFFILCVIFLLRGCPACWFFGLIKKLQIQKGE